MVTREYQISLVFDVLLSPDLIITGDYAKENKEKE